MEAFHEALAGATELTTLKKSVLVGELLVVRVVLRAPATVDLSGIEEKLVAIPGVKRVETRHLSVEDD